MNLNDKDSGFWYDSGEYLCLTLNMKKTGGRDVLLTDYTEVLANWKDRFGNNVLIEDFITEKDSLGKLHLHGIIYVKKNFYKKRLYTPGFHITSSDMYCKEQWIQYMLKQQPQSIDNKQYMF